ncbi:hypothetical protein [Povalibacter sp.]|uniref:hypothetical protein n=1 Tax=Povalibacter sp. TaxID=1962978 RepID=UPI002F410BD6
MTTITIASRYIGPPDSGNGGYCAGVIAEAIGEPVRVRLAQPVPIGTAMEVAKNATGGWDVHAYLAQGRTLIATASPHQPSAEVPSAPAWIEARGVSQHFSGFAQHGFPTCFVCGPLRAEGDGLRIFPGSVPGTAVFAAPWQPDESLAGADGRVRPEFIWAALDCPGYFATCSPAVALLGEFSVRIDHRPHSSESCVVTAWPIATHGRKHTAGSALFDADGRCSAVGVATWIELKK